MFSTRLARSLTLTARSGPLTAWINAWQHGRTGTDEVLRALGDARPLAELLVRWSRGSFAQCAAPVPGDVRWLAGPSDFRTAATEAGQAVIGSGHGLVPTAAGVWQAFAVADEPPPLPQLTEVQYDLTTATRDAAEALAAAHVEQGVDPDALAAARRAGERLNLPPGHPRAAVQLIAQAERLAAVLRLATADPTGGARTSRETAARAAVLRELDAAARAALVVGYSARA